MVSVGFKTDQGKLRDGNEDALFVLPQQQIYIVADGVGGHNSGELASRMTASYMAQYVSINPISESKGKRELKRYFKACFEGANELIFNKASTEAHCFGMATTAVLCYLNGSNAYVVNVGDSRAYLIRDGVLRQITEDHTCVQELINQGLITAEEAEKRPDKNMITRAIGGEESIKPDFFDFEVYKGDIILLCTDGLYGELDSSSILAAAKKSRTMRSLASNLISEANKAGGRDNITAVCIKIQ